MGKKNGIKKEVAESYRYDIFDIGSDKSPMEPVEEVMAIKPAKISFSAPVTKKTTELLQKIAENPELPTKKLQDIKNETGTVMIKARRMGFSYSKKRLMEESLRVKEVKETKGLRQTIEESDNKVFYEKFTMDALHNILDGLGGPISEKRLLNNGWEKFWITMDGHISYRKDGYFLALRGKEVTVTKGDAEIVTESWSRMESFTTKKEDGV